VTTMGTKDADFRSRFPFAWHVYFERIDADRPDLVRAFNKMGGAVWTVLRVALAHADHSTGRLCFPSQRRIAEEAHCSKRTVIRCLQRYENAGLVTVLRDVIPTRKGVYGNLYRWHWPPVDPCDEARQRAIHRAMLSEDLPVALRRMGKASIRGRRGAGNGDSSAPSEGDSSDQGKVLTWHTTDLKEGTAINDHRTPVCSDDPAAHIPKKSEADERRDEAAKRRHLEGSRPGGVATVGDALEVAGPQQPMPRLPGRRKRRGADFGPLSQAEQAARRAELLRQGRELMASGR